jgi:hypothetical protein
MKKFLIIAVIAILVINCIPVADKLIKSHNAEQRDIIYHQNQQIERIYYKGERIKEMQNASDLYEELQYELMCQTIRENSDYYEDFSKKFLSEFEKFGYDELYEMNGSFDLQKVDDKLENEINRDLVGHRSHIYNENGIIFVILGYPKSIDVFDFSRGYTSLESYDCSIIYIPDEYMNEESISTLKNSGILPFEHIKGNLFVMKYPVMNY